MVLLAASTTTGFMARKRPRKASEIDEDKFLAEDVAEFNERFARVIGEHERVGDQFRDAERRAVFDWAEDIEWLDGYD